MMESTEIVARENLNGAVVTRPPTAATGRIDASDLLLPLLALRQNTFQKDYMSEFNPGDILKLPDKKVVASKGKPCKVIPVDIRKVWRVQDITGTTPRTVRWEPFFQTDQLEWRNAEDQTFRRDLTFVAHVILADELKKYLDGIKNAKPGAFIDPDSLIMPVRVNFSRAARRSGQDLAGHFLRCDEMTRQVYKGKIRVSPASCFFHLLPSPQKNDKNQNWWAFELQKISDEKEKRVPEEFLTIANEWVTRLLEAATTKSVEAEDEEPAAQAPMSDGPKPDDIPF